jgi:3-methyl-2-oxobutanoate hydroxymethyltransferase
MIEAAIEGYATDVRARKFPGPEHVYGMKAANPDKNPSKS